MHTGPMPESSGTFDKGRHSDAPCDKCGKHTVYVKVWTSSCGGYDDYKITCENCGYIYWVDGPDA